VNAARHATILLMLADGATVAEMAQELGIGEVTVKHDLAELRKNFGAKNNCNLIALAYQRGVLHIGRKT
jgi:DNA-binding CsgD family transcriptional regulator